jgi:chromosome segregation ATPase
MIEQVMFFSIGFLAAALLSLVLAPLLHNRAVRLTTRQLEISIPASVAELRADKDQLRAEFAMSIRRLEATVERLKTKSATSLADIGKKKVSINLLQNECRDKGATICALEDQNKAIFAQSRALGERLELESSRLLAAQRALVEKEAECENLLAIVSDSTQMLSENKQEIQRVQNELDASKMIVQRQRDELAIAQSREISIADLHREIDRLEAQMNAVVAANLEYH